MRHRRPQYLQRKVPCFFPWRISTIGQGPVYSKYHILLLQRMPMWGWGSHGKWKSYLKRKKINKSSTVAEMDDRGHNRHGPKRWGLLCPFCAELGPRLIQCGLGRGLHPYQVASSSIRPFGHNKCGPKTGWWWVCPLLWGNLVGLRASGNLPVSYVLTGKLPVTYHQ